MLNWPDQFVLGEESINDVHSFNLVFQIPRPTTCASFLENMQLCISPDYFSELPCAGDGMDWVMFSGNDEDWAIDLAHLLFRWEVCHGGTLKDPPPWITPRLQVCSVPLPDFPAPPCTLR